MTYVVTVYHNTDNHHYTKIIVVCLFVTGGQQKQFDLTTYDAAYLATDR